MYIKHYQYTEYKNEIKSIYEKSFPCSERFDFDILQKCDKESNVHLSCIMQDDNPVGMQFTVELPNDITYLMYFAIDEKYRNQNIGSKALQNLVVSKNNVMLIIEKPEDFLTNRRKEFYLRNGFYSTNILFEDTSVQYEVLVSDKNYIPTMEDLLNRYKCMTSDKTTWKKIQKSFDTEKISIIKLKCVDEDKEKVTVVCYKQERLFNTRQEAKEFYLDCMNNSEGAERERYANIFLMLESGENICYDYEDEYKEFLEENTKKKYITREEYLSGKDGYIILEGEYPGKIPSYTILDTKTGEEIATATINLREYGELPKPGTIYVDPDFYNSDNYKDFKDFIVESKNNSKKLGPYDTTYMNVKLMENFNSRILKSYMLRGAAEKMSDEEIRAAVLDKVENEYGDWLKSLDCDKNVLEMSPSKILEWYANEKSHKEDILYLLRDNTESYFISDVAMRNIIKNCQFNALESIYQEWCTDDGCEYKEALENIFNEIDDDEEEKMPQIQDIALEDNLVPMPGIEKLNELKDEYSR